jgi:hypothetical protein
MNKLNKVAGDFSTVQLPKQNGAEPLKDSLEIPVGKPSAPHGALGRLHQQAVLVETWRISQCAWEGGWELITGNHRNPWLTLHQIPGLVNVYITMENHHL